MASATKLAVKKLKDAGRQNALDFKYLSSQGYGLDIRW